MLVNNGVTLIDETGPEVFKRVKDGARVGCTTALCTRATAGSPTAPSGPTTRSMSSCTRPRAALVAHLEAFAGNTIEFIRGEGPLLIDGIGIPDIDVDLHRRHVVIVAEEPGLVRPTT